MEHGEVQWVEIESLAGAVCKLLLPWESGARWINTMGEESQYNGNMAEWSTTIGEKFRIIRL
jgi:hypothetical protein